MRYIALPTAPDHLNDIARWFESCEQIREWAGPKHGSVRSGDALSQWLDIDKRLSLTF